MKLAPTILLALTALSLGACKTIGGDHWAGATDTAHLPTEWVTGDNYRCMRAFHVHLSLTRDYAEAIKECHAPAARGWAPAQTALGLAILSAVMANKLPAGEQLAAADAVALLRSAATSNEPLGMSLYGGILGGNEGRRLVGAAASLGVTQGAGWMASNGGAPNATAQEREDAFWAVQLIERTNNVALVLIRSGFEYGPGQLPAELRQRLSDHAKSIPLGPPAATPVSQQITFDVKNAINDRRPVKTAAGKPLVFLRPTTEQTNPTNREFARLLSEDPEIIATVRAHLETWAATLGSSSRKDLVQP